MKKMMRLLSAVMLILTVLTVVPKVNAAEKEYKVRIYAGNQGTIGGSDVLELTVEYGKTVTFTVDQVKLPENSKYYVKGIREAGLDNDEVGLSAPTITRDTDFVVAYGVKGTQVAYTVKFVSYPGGTQLAEPVTYYGNVGDKPVVAYKYIENYVPKYYNITQTLKENAADNVFLFEYVAAPTGTTVIVGPATPSTGGGGGGTTPGGGENAPAEGGEGNQGPQEILDIDDVDPPTAGPGEGGEPENGEATPGGKDSTPNVLPIVLGAGGVVLAIGGIWMFVASRKRDEDDEDEDEDSEE